MVSSPTKSSEKSEKWGEFPLQVSKLGYKFEISDQTAIGKSQNQKTKGMDVNQCMIIRFLNTIETLIEFLDEIGTLGVPLGHFMRRRDCPA